MVGEYRDRMVKMFDQEYINRSGSARSRTEMQVADVWKHWSRRYTRVHAFFHSYIWTTEQNFQRYVAKSNIIQADIQRYEAARIARVQRNLDLYQ